MADTATTDVPTDIRQRLALALDVDDLVLALRIGRQLRPYFGVAKVGLELYSAAGPEVIGTLTDLGYEVFLDLKLHDIPSTVNKAARVLGALGVRYVTMHAHGGVAMLQAGVEGLREVMAVAVPGLAHEGLVDFGWNTPQLSAKVSGAIVDYPIKDFYLTNAICRASPTMQRCSSELVHGEAFLEAAE